MNEPTHRTVLSIAELCDEMGISKSFFYKLQAKGRGPTTVKLGRRTLITREAATAWINQFQDQKEAKQ